MKTQNAGSGLAHLGSEAAEERRRGARRCAGWAGPQPPRGFTLIELLLVVSIIALLIGILLPALAEVRRMGRLAVCQSNTSQLGTAQANYANEFQDRIFAFTWRQGHAESTYADLRNQAAMGDMSAAAAQAVDILRRRAGRAEISPINGWIPNILYSHLVLQDYLASRLPEPTVVCPEDRSRLLWQRENGRLFDWGAWLPFQPVPGPLQKRWPYSSSYRVTVSSFDVGQSRDVRSATGTPERRVAQAYSAGCDGYMVPVGAHLGGGTMASVAHPSAKVHLFDNQDRHIGRNLYFAYPEASQPLLFFDGSVRIYRTSETNRGWDPNFPRSSAAMRWIYTPQGPWDAPAREGVEVEGHYRWTRGGLQGIDVGGGEVNTGQL